MVKTTSGLNKTVLTLIALLCAMQLFSQVTINGRVKNTKDTVIVFVKNTPDPILRNVDKRYKARINKNGSFRITLPENNIGEWIITFGNDRFQLLNLIKGQNLKIEADFSRKFPLKATGRSAADFNYLAYWIGLMMKTYYTSEYSKAIEQLDFDSTLLMRKAEYDYATELLERYKRSNKLNDKYYKWLKSKYKYEP